MREMAFLPHQDYMIFQPHHHQHHHDYTDEDDDHHHHHQDPSISLNILSSGPSQGFQGAPVVASLSMMDRSMSFSGYQHQEMHHDLGDHNQKQGQDQDHDHDHRGGDPDEVSDDGSQVVMVGLGGGEKKKRLSMEQVKTLEENFEKGNKLEPERKAELAKAIGLQPRQVAIWFQNRRARWKTKQLEKDFGVLKRHFDSLKTDHDSLVSHNKKLHAQLMSLKNREGTEYGPINLNNADTKSYWSNNGSEISSDINLGTSRTPQTGSPLSSNPCTKLQFSPNCFIPTTNLDLQCPKIDPPVQDDTFCNIFAGGGGGGGGGDGRIDQNQPPSFWTWPEQQHLN